MTKFYIHSEAIRKQTEDMDDFVIVNGRKFRKGFTTGSCAAAASKAAVAMLFSGNPLDIVDIDTPAGVRLKLRLEDITIKEGIAGCAVIKDGGDDPDITSGLKIFAEARHSHAEGIHVGAGEGIGTVTLPGLKVQPGNPAINPVPMRMIHKEVGEVLPTGKGVKILLSVPGGEAAAERTYNPKLGIVGGISILGTSGIVTPMSEEAWKESVAVELDVAVAREHKTLVFAFGNYGESFAVEKLGVDKNAIIKISNFIGFMLDKALNTGVESILLVGHLGKLVKVAAGIFHTHSRVADARMEIMTAYTALEGASRELLEKIYGCRTTEAAASILKQNGLAAVFDRVASEASRRCMEYCYSKVRVGVVLFNEDDTLLSIDENAGAILRDTESIRWGKR